MENSSAATAIDAVPEASKPMVSSETASTSTQTPPKWLLWTGVLGAFLALLSLLVVLLLGQRLLDLEASQTQSLNDRQKSLEEQQTHWRVQQQALLEQQALVVGLRQALSDGLTQLESRMKAQQSDQAWQFTDVKVVQLMAAQLQGLSLLSVEPSALLAFIHHWQALLAAQNVESSHPLSMTLRQEAQDLNQLSTQRSRLDEQTWRVWQGLIDYYAPASANGLIKPSMEAVASEATPWWGGLLKFIRITPAEGLETSHLTQLRDATLWQTQASMALIQLRWGLQTDQPTLVQAEGQRLAQLLAVMGIDLPETMSLQLTAWQSWTGWAKPEWRYLRDYLAQPVAVTQP